MFRSCLFGLVLAVVLLFMLMSLPLALSGAQSPPALAGSAVKGGEVQAAPSPTLTPTAVASSVPTQTVQVASSLPALPSGRRLRAREAFLLGGVFMSVFALLIRGTR